MDAKTGGNKAGSTFTSRFAEGTMFEEDSSEDVSDDEEARYNTRQTGPAGFPGQRRAATDSTDFGTFARAFDAFESAPKRPRAARKGSQKAATAADGFKGPAAGGAWQREGKTAGPGNAHTKGGAVPPRPKAGRTEDSGNAGAGGIGGNPRGGADAGAGPAPGSPDGGGSARREPVDTLPLNVVGPEKESAIEDLIAKVDTQLDATRAKDLEWKRQHFKELMLKWHPDKNKDDVNHQATEVFKHLMAQRASYLDT